VLHALLEGSLLGFHARDVSVKLLYYLLNLVLQQKTGIFCQSMLVFKANR
jgi:hypothetical protein